MEELLVHYEHELGLLNQRLVEFAARFPKIAARLGLSGGDTDDPHINQLLQTFAFEAAHIGTKLADDYPEFTEAFLDIAYPGYLRTIPSCAIARFEPALLAGQMTEPFTVPRGTSLDARVAPCRFQTVYDVVLSPLQIHAARYIPTTLAPTTARLPTDATGIISLTFASASSSGQFDTARPSDTIRIHLSGARTLVAPLADTLLMHACCAFVEADHDGHWHPLSKVPVSDVGYHGDEQLLPESGQASHRFGYLLEFFAFPEKFDFIDIDLGRMRRATRHTTPRRLTLHIAVRNTPPESHTGQSLASLDDQTFQLFCTPVINLFKRSAKPILLTSGVTTWPIVPTPLQAGAALDIYSIDAVYLGDQTVEDKHEQRSGHRQPRTAIYPYRAFTHSRSHEPSDAWWIAYRDPDGSLQPFGEAMLLSLVDLDGRPMHPARPQVDVDTTATNRDLPSQLPIGSLEGDLLDEGAALSCPITLLTQPTLSARLPRGQGALWRVLCALSAHPIDLTVAGLSALKAFLRLHVPRSISPAHRCIDAIKHLDYQPVMRWMSLDSQFPSFVRGIEIHLTFDESALRDVSLHALTRTLDRFFAPYASTNSYVQLVVHSAQSGFELIRHTPRQGTRALI
ncbi:type VI secretion system baseplate subunit TssF [Burkholderia sp. Bp9012]|uniref:type VI secretion system baseplate subunit TssF n=1 Tax=Burkholderia sp. Bp9012 TaxID=2184562 RepID=UPI000F590CC2|nr:type VI secretion system baseplate subunit TssF [Burkholderia sp. Bp9012]RQR79254.1 type VI secretion system baseplate subunit TssF [Burkholderia sp. Bp9012]